LFVGGLILTLQSKEYLDVTILRAKGAPYEILNTAQGKTITNHFKLDLSNQTGAPLKISFSMPNQEHIDFIMPMNPTTLEKGEWKKVDFFVRFSPEILNNGSKLILLHMQYNDTLLKKEITIVGPNL